MCDSQPAGTCCSGHSRWGLGLKKYPRNQYGGWGSNRLCCMTNILCLVTKSATSTKWWRTATVFTDGERWTTQATWNHGQPTDHSPIVSMYCMLVLQRSTVVPHHPHLTYPERYIKLHHATGSTPQLQEAMRLLGNWFPDKNPCIVPFWKDIYNICDYLLKNASKKLRMKQNKIESIVL